MRSVRESLTASLDALDAAGWCQGVGEDAEGNICLGRAIIRGRDIIIPQWQWVSSLTDSEIDLFNKAVAAWAECHHVVLEAIKSLFPDRVNSMGVPGFNDHPQTTLEDVRLVLKTAIEATEQ